MTFGVTQAEGVVAVPGGAGGLGSVYGSFQNLTSLTGSTTVGSVITYDTDDYNGAGHVTLALGSRITVPNTGVYNLQFSAQLSSLDNAPQDVYIWARINGVDVPRSNGIVGLAAKKTPSNPFHTIASWNLFLSMDAGQYVELVWYKTSADVTMIAYAGSSTPVYPSIPSIIVTINQIG